MRTKAEYIAFRKTWGAEHQRLCRIITAAKLEVRLANSAWAKSPSALTELRFKQAQANLKASGQAMSKHFSALWAVQAENQKRLQGIKDAAVRAAVSGTVRASKPIAPGIMEKLERFKPIAIVLRRKDDKLQGLVELSFAMDWDERRVNLFWSGKAYSMLGEHMLDGMKDAHHNAKGAGEVVFDALSPECPVDIDWERWLAATDKFNKRNAAFVEKASLHNKQS